MGLLKAAKHFEVPKTTLRRLALEIRLSPKEVVGKKLGRKPTLPDGVEKELVDYLLLMESKFYGFTTMDVRRMAYQLAARNGIEHHFAGECAGRAWFDHFLRRHREKLANRKSTGISHARTGDFNRERVKNFYDKLETEYLKHNYPPDRVWNVDEIGLSVVQSKTPQVVGLKGKRQIGALTAAERGFLVTVICSMSAGGSYVPPMLIYPRTNITETLMKGAPPGSIGRAHPSGWVQSNLFTQWFEHFISKTAPTEKSPVLLILDGHYSHTRNVDVIDLASKNHVSIISLPSHTTHKLQPLDRTFMEPLKTHYTEHIRKFMLDKDRPLGSYDITELFGNAYLQCTTRTIALDGFRVTGILPFNRNLFGDTDFIAENEFPQLKHNPIRSIDSGNTSKYSKPIVPSCSFTTTPSSCNVRPEHSFIKTHTDVDPSTRKKTTKGRKTSCLARITGSTYKAQLASSVQQIEEKTRSIKDRGRSSCNSSKEISSSCSGISGEVQRGRCGSRPKKSRAKRTSKYSKKSERDDSGSDESMDLPSDSSCDSPVELPVGEPEPDKEDASCLFCEGKFSGDKNEELWVQCLMCGMWAHSDCAGAEKKKYVCDFCR